MPVIVIDVNLFDLQAQVYIENNNSIMEQHSVSNSNICDFALSLSEKNNINNIYVMGLPSYAEQVKNEIMEKAIKEYKNINVEVIA